MSGLAEQARQWFAKQDKSGLVVTEKPGTKTGYEFVRNVDPDGRYPFQAAIKVKADGATRGTLRTLPGLFVTALEAAQYRALLLQQGGQDSLEAPRKQKPRISAGVLLLCGERSQLTCICSPRLCHMHVQDPRSSAQRRGASPRRRSPAGDRSCAKFTAPLSPPSATACSEATCVVRVIRDPLSPRSQLLPVAVCLALG